MNKKIRAIGAGVLVAVWLSLTALAWFAPAKESSDAERRPLAQLPALTAQSLLGGSFMEDFESYSLDQFPLRDSFRRLKALMSNYGLWQMDNNGVYLADGHAAQMEYPLNEASLDRALSQFNKVYETYLRGRDCKVIATVVPDKSFYLAQGSGHLAMDYEKLFAGVQTGMPWAQYVDITACLQARDYYYTDTHWRQENLLPAAQKISSALGVVGPVAEDFTKTKLERPFYGAYYGQAALPMDPDTVYLMESPLLSACRVYNYTTQAYTQVYDPDKLDAKDLYEVYLSGPQSLLRIENPNAKTDRELIVFRDSFGSSLVPLLVQDYAAVTLIDIRYITPEMLGRYVAFDGRDVLFMYSTLVLNTNAI